MKQRLFLLFLFNLMCALISPAILARTDEVQLTGISNRGVTNTVIVEKPVPTDPTDDFCNIGSHIVWIVLFWISFALNVAVVAFIISYYFMKKKKTSDDTPLVDYDITDDVE